jgi:hypothetical protein
MLGRHQNDVIVTRKGDEVFTRKRGKKVARVTRIPGDVSAITDPGDGEVSGWIVDEGGQ